MVQAGNIEGTANGVAEIVLFIFRTGDALGIVLPGISVEKIVAEILEGAAVELAGAGFGFDFDGARAVAAVLRAVVGGEDFKFGDSFEVGVDVEGLVAAIVHVVAAVELPVVVLVAAAVDAEGDVASNADGSFIFAGLVGDARGEGDELAEVAAIEFELIDLFAGDGGADFRGLSVYLGDVFAVDDHFLGDGADSEGDVNAGLLRNVENDLLDEEFLKAGGGDGEIVGAAGKAGNGVSAVGVGFGVAGDATSDGVEDDFGASDGGAGLVGDGAGDIAGVLREDGDGDEQEKQRGAERQQQGGA